MFPARDLAAATSLKTVFTSSVAILSAHPAQRMKTSSTRLNPYLTILEDEYDWYVRPQARALSIRGHHIALDTRAEALAQRGLELLEPPNVDPVVVMRSLLPEQRILLLATPEELAARNPDGLPLLMKLDEWFHPDLAAGELPSGCETFQMLAEAIATGDAATYRPTRKPNTQWWNWPDGGTL